jgi:putative sigma-54 modulation protein
VPGTVDSHEGASPVPLVAVTGRHIEITDAMKQYAEEKMGRLDRYYDRIGSIDVICEQESNRHRVEVLVRADHKNTFVAQVDANDFYEAVDLVLDKLERQLTRHKEKHRNRKHSA